MLSSVLGRERAVAVNTLPLRCAFRANASNCGDGHGARPRGRGTRQLLVEILALDARLAVPTGG